MADDRTATHAQYDCTVCISVAMATRAAAPEAKVQLTQRVALRFHAALPALNASQQLKDVCMRLNGVQGSVRFLDVHTCRYTGLDLQGKDRDFLKKGPYAVRYTLHLDTGAAECEHLTPQELKFRCEFPVVAQPLVGHRHRYGYCGLFAESARDTTEGVIECASALPRCDCQQSTAMMPAWVW